MLVLPPLLFTTMLTTASPSVGHDLAVQLDIARQRIDVVDTVTLAAPADAITFVIHAGLQPKVDDAEMEFMSADAPFAVPAEQLRVRFRAPRSSFVVRYGGVIAHPPLQVSTEHQRSFQETPGTVEGKGVYLSAAALWFPLVRSQDPAEDPALVTARVRVAGLPAGWRALAEGEAVGANAWSAPRPLDDLHLVAGPFREIRAPKRGVDVLIWLRTDREAKTDDDTLAQRYLEVTGQYLELYGELIGPYPYKKFALVENFWETGYGMASFTLLGPQVIRFPFILHTSWPHELLHNWWGNGVFVKGGNWSEGLTAYLADHFTAEREGRGDEYRRTTLQKYMDFVGPDPALDFPLAQFGSRFSAASEAVGYGKWLMVVHMLRRKLGDEAFKAGLQKLWADHRGTRASFDDVRAAFQAQTAEDLAPFFTAWVERTGAPQLRLVSAGASRNSEGRHRLDVVLEQVQRDAPFPLDIPVVATLTDGRTVVTRVTMDGRSRTARAAVQLAAAPVRVDIDPFADTFRTLLPGETAPSLSKTLGARRAVFVLPSIASAEEREAWRRFMGSICGSEIACTAIDDTRMNGLPDDAAVWVLGYGNALRAAGVNTARRFGARFDDRGFLSPGPWSPERWKADRTDPSRSSLVLAGENPRNARLGLAFVGAHTSTVIDLLARKIPHYGKYGFLGFGGDAAENNLKGPWQPDASPFTVFLGEKHPPLAAKSGPALATLPPPLDGDRMLRLVAKLSSFHGRGQGTKDLDAALALVEDELRGAGLSPRRVCHTASLCNVVATLEGKDPSLPHVVLGAHADHLGRVKGQVYPGADDNASGVAVLVEVARELRKTNAFARSVDFIAFSGEEEALRGARAWVASLGASPQTKVHSMVNLDTVGRRGAKNLLVLDGASAAEWVHIFRGVGFTTGVPSELARDGGGASDQQAFLEVGIPAVQIFGGPHADYHRPTDTPDKVDASRLVEAAVVAREVVAYLAERKEPLTAAGTSSTGTAGGGGTRRASLGTIPDMTFTGVGVAVDDVVAGSPAASAGLKKGDVLVRFGGAAVTDLRGYSELLKGKNPGDRVEVVVGRDGKELTFVVTLGER